MSKKHAVTLLLCAGILTSCASFPSGTISKAPVYYPAKAAPGAAKHPIPVTFSLELENTYGNDARISKGQIAAAIQNELQACGLFSSVDCVPAQQAGTNHLAFTAKLSGRPKAERIGINILGGLTLTTIPTWTTLHMELSATAQKHGKAQGNWQSTQSCTEILWVPLALAAPFCNHETARAAMLQNAMQELAECMRADECTRHIRN